ncbi:hypothetical protein [Flavobacterium cerinum]|uniref:Lipoprotein n=1 Tax=Flavobacterium cerinum TaxID=2502784 RepID=A0A3S3QDN5_9FLAO|nr:hypothetical protein [Flavobacterium cerinum]RWX01003.1 hypothetical protein EPI11_08250 [Flavobacterium cerinum]
MKKIKNIALIASFIIAVSCGKTEKTKKKGYDFENEDPKSEIYKENLANYIKTANKDGLAFYFDGYTNKDGQHYVDVTIEGDINAKTIMKVNKPEGELADIIKVEGKSYHGAEFKNLQLDFVKDSLKSEFIYISSDDIVD